MSRESEPSKANTAHAEKPANKQEGGSLLASTSIVSAMTLLSRVLGLVRDVVVAQYFGARADAFFVAFKIPNFFRRLFAEGAFSVAFVPVLSEYKKLRTEAEVKLLIASVSGVLGAALLLVTVLALLLAPWLPYVFAPGFSDQPEKFALTGELLRITFPYLFFISLTAFAGSVLNSYGKFAIPAFTPVLLNLCLIFAVVVMTHWFVEPLYALAWGVLMAGFIQFVFQLPFLAQMQKLTWPRYRPKDQGVIRILKLMGPALFGVSVSQINLLLDTLLASFLETGSVSWLYYSDRLNNLPLGLFAIAIGVVILPSLSRQHADNDSRHFGRTLDWAVRIVMMLALPAALALIVLATPLMSTIFFHGAVTEYDIGKMTMSLQAYGSGLVAFMLIKVLAPGYYARQDTKTPVKIGIQAMAVNMVLNLILVFPLQHVGLALATSLAAYFNAYMLYRGLKQQGYYQAQAGWWSFSGKVTLALLALFGVIFLLMGQADQWLLWDTWHRIGSLSVIVAAGVAIYFIILLLAGLRPRHIKGELF